MFPDTKLTAEGIVTSGNEWSTMSKRPEVVGGEAALTANVTDSGARFGCRVAPMIFSARAACTVAGVDVTVPDAGNTTRAPPSSVSITPPANKETISACVRIAEVAEELILTTTTSLTPVAQFPTLPPQVTALASVTAEPLMYCTVTAVPATPLVLLVTYTSPSMLACAGRKPIADAV